MDPFEALEQFFPDIIDRMSNRFNSHKFILELAHQHQRLYVQALYQYADHDSPFKTVHSQLAKALKNRFDHLVSYEGEERSTDIFGHRSDIGVWEKK